MQALKRVTLVGLVCWSVMICQLAAAEPASAELAPLKALIVDGQNNHAWAQTTPVLKQALEESKRFTVEVATSPAKGKDMSAFRPKFSDYDVVVSNYNGENWSKETQTDLINYVNGGGGLVIVHAANNSFPNWPEYNTLIGIGGWGGRNEKSGPYIRYRDGKIIRDEKAGSGGHHGPQHDFVVITRSAEHPVTKGLPTEWLHVKDELYDRLRGPAENLEVLATAFSDPAKGGSAEHEPMLMTIKFGKGRVFHTALGHSVEAMNCVGFRSTLTRGAEWAATDKVTLPAPENFPSKDKTSSVK